MGSSPLALRWAADRRGVHVCPLDRSTAVAVAVGALWRCASQVPTVEDPIGRLVSRKKGWFCQGTG